jgi:hypothetical protein
MMKWWMSVALLAFVWIDPEPAIAQSIVGKWLGLNSPQEWVKCWLNERRQNGTFEVTFLAAAPFGLRRQVEEGTWSFANGLYSTITTLIDGSKVNPGDPQFRDTYRVIELTGDRFVLSHIEKGWQFTAYRVTDSFALGQSCPMSH